MSGTRQDGSRQVFCGEPDLLAMARDVCGDFAAEAVLVVSNKAATWNVVHGLESVIPPDDAPHPVR
jgi:hypothetical protein